MVEDPSKDFDPFARQSQGDVSRAKGVEQARAVGKMAAELVFGSVPPVYRRIYEILCPAPDTFVDREMFVKFLSPSKLSRDSLLSVWDMLDCKSAFLKRNCLYKALALIALLQQGKQLHDRILETFAGQELPSPELGDLQELQALGMKLRREMDPSQLGVTFRELCQMDFVTVELVPEKKGLFFLKHVEYQVTSLRYRCKTLRRYNDFVALHDILLARYLYRTVPRLPPKKVVGADARFIERRRRALTRFLTLIVRHPAFGDDRIVRFFLTYNGPETQSKIREQFHNVPEEFLVSDVATRRDLVPQDARLQLATSREQIWFIHSRLARLDEVVSRMVARSRAYAADLLDIKNELGTLVCDPHISSSWATGCCDTWTHLKKGFRDLCREFDAMFDKAVVQASMQEEETVEQLHLFLDLLTAYKHLWERYDKDSMQDQQKMLTKVITIRKRVQQASMHGANAETKDNIESCIVEQENHLEVMERRNQFALYCIHMETQLVHVSMEILVQIFRSMSCVFASSHSELSKVWDNIRPVVEKILPANHRQTSNGSPDGSGQTSPTSESSSTLGSPSL